MSDFDANAENSPETQTESDGEGSGRPPRKTAIGAPDSEPYPGVVLSEAQTSRSIPYASIYEMLQVEDGANFEIMSRAHKVLYHELDTSFFTPNEQKQKQQDLLVLLWNGWHKSPESQGSMTSEKFFANRSFSGLNHYQVFQVLPTAKLSIIKAIYEYLERLYHPDNQATCDEAKYKIVDEAWKVLSDPTSRNEYDESLQATIGISTSQRGTNDF